MNKKFILHFYILSLLFILLKCSEFSSTELENMLRDDIDISDGFDLIIDEDLFLNNKITKEEAKKIIHYLKIIKNHIKDNIYLIMVEKHNGDSNSLAQKLSEEHCDPKETCVFIIYDDNQKKIGSEFGEKTELSPTTVNEIFDNIYLSDQNNDRYLYDSLNDLLDYINTEKKKGNKYYCYCNYYCYNSYNNCTITINILFLFQGKKTKKI